MTDKGSRRNFLKGIGAFLILPGAGRIWRAVSKPTGLLSYPFQPIYFKFVPNWYDMAVRERVLYSYTKEPLALNFNL